MRVVQSAGQSASGDSGEALLEQGRCLLRRTRSRV